MVHISIQTQSDSTDSRKQTSSCSFEGVIAKSERGISFSFVSLCKYLKLISWRERERVMNLLSFLSVSSINDN